MALGEYITVLNRLIDTWGRSLSDPLQLLSPSLPPTPEQTSRGFEFFVGMLALSLLLYSPLLIRHGDDFGDKVRIAANAAVSILGSLAGALVWDLSFRLLGGGNTFAGSFLAFAYGLSPYTPLISVSVLVMVSALPPRLWPYAVNPLSAEKAFNQAFNDPATKKSMLILGFLMTLLFLGVSYWKFFRCLEFVHGLRGLRALGAIVVALFASGAVGKVIQNVLPVILPPLEEAGTAQPQPLVAPPNA